MGRDALRPGTALAALCTIARNPSSHAVILKRFVLVKALLLKHSL